ncbi:MAG: molybdate ABC transporter substrate-binding protein [Geminicoccaceae bacterium]
MFERTYRLLVFALQRFSMAAALALLLPGQPVLAGEVRIACASNFTMTLRKLVQAFEAGSEHTVQISTGATGQLYAQITQGAPFDLFLAADQARPQRLVADALAAEEDRFTYATGRLALFTAADQAAIGPGRLAKGDFERLAIANPLTAPYGAAAMAVLDALALSETLAAQIVQGTSIAQTFQFVISGNAELGFVAQAQTLAHGGGTSWLVPQDLHPPLHQDGVILTAAKDNTAARAFMAYLGSDAARALIRADGYAVPES